MGFCSPGRNLNSNSCFTKLEWTIINRLLPKKSIETCKKSKSKIFDECILDKLVKKKEIDSKKKWYVIKPNYKDRGVLLDTDDLNFVLDPYSQLFPNFCFLGTFPSNVCEFVNFKKEINSIYNKQIFQNKLLNYSAIVFNNDTHNQEGSHWVGLFINVITSKFEFFDSLGKKPQKNILECILKIKKIFEGIFKKKFQLYINDKIFQTDGNECGVWVCYFIISKLFGYPSIKNLNDLEISKFRKIIFKS